MITLTKLVWSNCFSFDDTLHTLDLSSYHNLRQLLGPNGAGKTSIMLILQEGLYGKNVKNIKKVDISNRHTDKNGYYIEVHFEKDGNKYKVITDRKSNLKLSLYKNEEDISSHKAPDTYKDISNILGVEDYNTFFQITYQSSKDSLDFLTSTDSNRKKFLIKLLNLEKYTQIQEVFKKASRECTNKLKTLEGSIESISSWLNEHKKKNLSIQAYKDEPEQVPQELYSKLNDLKSKLNNAKTINSKIEQNRQYKELLDSLDMDCISKQPFSIDDREENKLREQISDCKVKGKIYKEEISKIEKLKDSCPECKQPVDEKFKENYIKEREASLSELREMYDKAYKELKVIEDKKSENRKIKNEQDKFERYKNKIDEDLSDEFINEVELSQELNSLDKEIKEISNKCSEIIEYNRKVSSHNKEVEIIKGQISDFKAKLDKHSEEYDKLDRRSSLIDVLKQAFSTKGLVSYKIESSVKELEKEMNRYLSEFSMFHVYFNLDKDKLNVDLIDDEGKETSITSLSSGELARINLSTVLAIRNIMSALGSSKINLLFLDEVVGVLDTDGKDKLANILMEEKLDTFMVAHDFNHPLVPQIHVYRDNNGFSKVEQNG